MLGSLLDIESLTQQAIRRQLAAMPNKLYLIRLIHSVERKRRARLGSPQQPFRDRRLSSRSRGRYQHELELP
jgi:hypothetical protein